MDQARYDEPRDDDIVAAYADIPDPLFDLECAYRAATGREGDAERRNRGAILPPAGEWTRVLQAVLPT